MIRYASIYSMSLMFMLYKKEMLCLPKFSLVLGIKHLRDFVRCVMCVLHLGFVGL